MAIAPQVIDEIIARCDIVDIISDYLSLNQKGNSYWGLCPFHGENTPSFHVVPDRQMYHCFGCGKGGGVISFIMEVEQIPFIDAIHVLAKKVGVTIPENNADDSFIKKKQRLLALNKEAARFFYMSLYDYGGQVALTYLQNRKITKATITRFGLGFAQDGWDHLLQAMIKLGYSKMELLDAGLATSAQNGRIYDRFRNRVMFPIIDVRGDVIGFGGRVLDDSMPKYLNSPDSILFNKSQHVYALNFAKQSKMDKLILTEGYMDTIALHQAGFDGAVASLGTAFTAKHATLLSKYTKEVILAFDSDDAGVAAANRAISFLEKAGLKVKVLQMQGAKDPDEFIKKFGKERFEKLLNDSENHIDYQIAHIQRKYDLAEPMQKIEFAKETSQMIATLPSAMEREVYAGRISMITDIAKDAVMQDVNRAYKINISKIKKKQQRKIAVPTQDAQPKSRQLRYENVRSALAEEGVIRLLMLDNSLFQNVDHMKSQSFSSPFLGKVFEEFCQQNKDGRKLSFDSLTSMLSSEEMSHLVSVLNKPESLKRSSETLKEYISIIESEYIASGGLSDDDILLRARENYQKKKSWEM